MLGVAGGDELVQQGQVAGVDGLVDPVQDFFLTKVAKRADGKFQTEIVEKVFSNYGDRYAKDCAAQ